MNLVFSEYAEGRSIKMLPSVSTHLLHSIDLTVPVLDILAKNLVKTSNMFTTFAALENKTVFPESGAPHMIMIFEP